MKSVTQALARWARWFGVARAVCIVLLFALIPLRVIDPPPLQEVRLRSFDLFQVLRPREQQALSPVVIVDIDEASLKEIGQWPWPRTVVADLVSKLKDRGAVAIGFDIIFAEPDRMSPAVAVESFRGLDDETRSKLASLPSNDEVLADAMKRARVIVGQSGSPLSQPRSDAEKALQTGFAIIGPDPTPLLVTFKGLLRNVPLIEQAAAGRGVLSIDPDRDGIIRRVPVILTAQDVLVPSLAMEMLRVVTGSGAIQVRADEAGVQSVGVRGLAVPTDNRGRVWVHFNKIDRERSYVSAKDLLQGRLPPDRVRGRLVLVGTSAIGLFDIKTTPVDAAMPGVEVHAQILESVLTKAQLAPVPDAIGAEIVIAVLLGLAIIVAAPALSPTVVVVLGAAMVAGLVGLSWYLFAMHSLLLDFTYPLMSSWLIYLVLTFVNYFREQRQRQQIRSAFGYYLSPHMVEQLARSPEKLVLGGEERRMTILFSDVRGFTTISEHFKDNPQGLTQLMNRFLTPLTNAIIERKGTIDKYIGDAIMAFWNAPVDDAEQEVNACDAALAMQERAVELNAELKQEAETGGGTYMPLRIGIGLNTGPCVVGNMGSEFKFNYSVLGDTVNVASRLEARTKDYRLPLVIGSRTAERAQEKFTTMEIDLIQVKGKKEPEAVFTVLGRSALKDDPHCTELRALNADMLVAFRKQDWDGALALIERCRSAANGLDVAGLYDMYVERISTYRADPPPPDWDGVYEAESK